MDFQRPAKMCGTIVAMAFMVSCSGASEPGVGPSSGMLRNFVPMPSSAISAVRADREKSWMSADAKKSSLLYVSNAGTLDVTVYTYSNGNGLKLVGTLTGFPYLMGICVDKVGNVYVPTVAPRGHNGPRVYEYAHGGTVPIATFSAHLGQPQNCSVDPKAGSLALLDHESHYYGMDITVWPNGNPSSGPIRYVEGSDFSGGRSLAYDNASNLYFDDGASLFKLTGGTSPFTPIKVVGATLHSAGGMQWGNPNLLVGDYNGPGTSVAYRLQISGTTATVVGSVPFTGSTDVYGFWRVGTKIVAADNGANNVGVYTFPAGSLYASLTTGVSSPYSAVISQ